MTVHGRVLLVEGRGRGGLYLTLFAIGHRCALLRCRLRFTGSFIHPLNFETFFFPPDWKFYCFLELDFNFFAIVCLISFSSFHGKVNISLRLLDDRIGNFFLLHPYTILYTFFFNHEYECVTDTVV